MASHTLALTGPSSNLKRAAAPIHAAFSASRDLLAVLWEAGYLEVHRLNTRLDPGRGKAMDPSLLWSGTAGTRGVRQVVFEHSSPAANVVSLAVLGLDTALESVDIVYHVEVRDGDAGAISTTEVALPSRNGRLVPGSMPGVCWQARDGVIHDGLWWHLLVPGAADIHTTIFDV